MAWLATHRISVVPSALGSDAVFTITLTSPSGREYATQRSLIDCRACCKRIAKATQTIRHVAFLPRWTHCACAGKNCAFQDLHETVDGSVFSTSKRGHRDMELLAQQIERWLRQIQDFFGDFATTMLIAKLRQKECLTLMTLAAFVGGDKHFARNEISSPQTLRLEAWRREHKLQASEEPTSPMESEVETKKTKISSQPSTRPSEVLPRLGVQHVPVETMESFLTEYCEQMVEQCGADLLEQLSADVSIKTRWGIYLFVACRSDDVHAVNLILSFHEDVVNAVMQDGTSCLQASVQRGYDRIVKVLLERGADVNSTNAVGMTPLMTACRNGATEIAKMLLEQGADVHAVSGKGTCALHAAIIANSLDIVELLLRHGADVNAQTTSGITPLHLAAKLGSIELSELLLKYRADPAQQTQNGCDARMVASTNGHTAICELIERQSMTHPTEHAVSRLQRLLHVGKLAKLLENTSETRAPQWNGAEQSRYRAALA